MRLLYLELGNHSEMWSVARYIAQDVKNTGFTYHKAAFKLLGLFYWRERNWWRRLYELVPIANLGVGATLIMLLAIENGEPGSSKGFIEIVKGSVLVFTLYFAMLKLVLFHIYREEIRLVVDFLESQPREGGLDTSGNLRKGLVRYSALLLITGCGWAVFNSISTGSPYECYWPFGTPNPKMLFELLAFIQKLMTLVYCVFSHSTVDTTLPMLVTYMAYQATRMDALLETIGNGGDDFQTIKKAVDLHVILLMSLRYIRSAFQVLFMCQVIYTIVHACVIAFSAIKVGNMGFVVTSLLPILCSAYMQLLLYCQAGERMTTILDRVSFAICDNYWYHCDLKTKKSMVIMLLVASKNMTMNSFGIFTASLKNYKHSVQESLSYFLALKTISSKL